MMNLIDIASWQKGIELSVLFAKNSLDGVIVKATQGVTYTNPEYSAWVKWLSDHDKPFGMYHYCDGADADKEAEHFYNTVKPYIGKGIPIADYEGEALLKGTAWLKRFLDRFYALSGIKAMIYCSLSVVREQPFDALTDHPLWIAQYADMNTVYGFVDKPWQKGSVSPFNGYVMHQYTSCGLLNGYNGKLDFNQFNGSYAQWVELARGASVPVTMLKPTALKPADPVVVSDVLAGKYGTGTERAAKLKADDYDSDSVQRKINELYAIALSCKKYFDGNLDYINSIIKIIRLL